MKRGFVTFLNEGEVECRQKGLRALGLSDHAITALRKRAKQLCDVQKARARIANLAQIGFVDPMDIVESQPYVLMRSEDEVTARINFWKSWCRIVEPNISIYAISRCRAQIFSAAIEKVHIIFLISQFVKGTTISRICNVVTLNIENVLLMFARYRDSDLSALHCHARRCKIVNKCTTREERLQLVRNVRDALPRSIYAAYIHLMITAHPRHAKMIVQVLQS